MAITAIGSPDDRKPYVIEHWDYLTAAGPSPGVDAFRALAISMVLLFHLSLMPFGWLGVDLFFVISGFLIGGMIIDRMRSDTWSFWKFYRDRALRILPLYYFMIGLYAVFKGIPSTQGLGIDGVKAIIASLLFAQTTVNWRLHWGLNANYIVDGSWSLVIEEYFYLIAPLALFIAFRITKGRLLPIAVMLCVAALMCLIAKLWIVQLFPPTQPEPFFTFSVEFPFKFDALIFGVIAAVCVRCCRPGMRVSVTLLAIGCAISAISILLLRATPAWQAAMLLMRDVAWLPAMFAAGAAVVIAATHNWKIAPAPVVVLARLSYPLYLGHIFLAQMNPFFDFLGFSYARLGFAGMPAAVVAICVAFAYLLSIAVEYPFIRLYRRKAGADAPTLRVSESNL